MPRSLLDENNVSRIVGGGSALIRNTVLQEELQSCYNLPVILDSRGDAAYGAALAAITTSRK